MNDEYEELEEYELADHQHHVTFVENITPEEFEKLVEQAMEIWIASAYANAGGIRNLAATLKRRGGAVKVNFLLSSKFAPMDYLKEAIIRELDSIPNSEVRVTDPNAAFFHPKVYVFVDGNIATVIVGSMNLTEQGLSKHVEAGIRIRERIEKDQIHKKAINFIEKHWLEATRVKPDPSFKLPDAGQKYNFRDRVMHKPSGKKGMVVAAKLEDGIWRYLVYCSPNDSLWAIEHELMLETISILAGPESIASDLANTSTRSYEFVSYLVHRKLADVAEGGIFSYQSSRTRHYDYQFHPLLKMLAEDKRGILIADEVGLGKTIEAAIILKELSTKAGGFKRCLILCPKNLVRKWEKELKRRFDEYFLIGTFDDLFRVRERYSQDLSSQCRLIIPFSQIQRSKHAAHFNMFDVPLDLVIVDEAHWMRNPETNLYKNALKLLTNSRFVVFLTATPVNTGIMDILPFLKILDYETFGQLDEVGFRTLMAPMQTIMQCYHDLANAEQEFYLEAIRQVVEKVDQGILSHRRFKNYYSENVYFDMLVTELEKLEQTDEAITQRDISRVRHILLKLNPINAVVSRTRKIDVPELKTIIRNPVTLSIDPTEEEHDAYEEVKKVVTKAAKGPAAFGTMQPERVAASCLPIAKNRYLGAKRVEENPSSSETLDMDSLDFDIEGDTTHHNVPTNPSIIEDTKYECLKSFLKGLLKEEEKPIKVLLFSSFVGTVEYLRLRLVDDFGDGFADVMSGLTPYEIRDSLQDNFRNNINPSILLCTEVASEGLDFEFCRVLVNYDLPWNPMKIEQRIGRIDRIGQEADKISIVNLIVRGTIDEAIYERVTKRVIEIRSTIGPLSRILGNMEKHLVPQLLTPDLSEDERSYLLREYEARVEKAQEVERNFEENRTDLVGLDPFFSKEISLTQNNRKYFTPEECLFVVERYLRSVNDEYDENSRLTARADGNIHSLILDSRAQAILIDRMATSPLISLEKRDAMVELIRSHKEIGVTFDQDTAMKNLDLEFLTVHHPILQTELQHYSPSGSFSSVKVEMLESDIVHAGEYLLLVFPTIVEDSVTKRIRTVYFRMELYSIENKKVMEPMSSGHIYERMLRGDCTEISESIELKTDSIQECLQIAIRSLEENLKELEKKPTDIVRSETIAAYVKVNKTRFNES